MSGALQITFMNQRSFDPPFWIGTLKSPVAVASSYAATASVDSNKDIYFVGQTSGGDPTGAQIAKYDSSGLITSQRVFGAASRVIGSAVDSSNNVYYLIQGTNPDTGRLAIFVQKRNLSGVIQWQIRFTSTVTQLPASTVLRSITVDTSNNVYVSLDHQGDFSEQAVVIKINSSGSVVWNRNIFPNNSTPVFGNSVAVNSSGDVYVGGLISVSGDGQEAYLYKLDSSGVTQWQRRFGGAGTQNCRSVALDSNGNVYILGLSNFAEVFLAKFDSSGTLQWQRKFTNPAGISLKNDSKARCLTIDSNNNIYATGFFKISSNPDLENAFIVKYNSSGVIQWQRRLGPPSVLGGRTTRSQGAAVTVDSDGVLYFFGDTNVFVDEFRDGFLFAKLPSDGSKTGTYTVGGFSFTYAASNFTESAGTFTSNTINYSSGNLTLTIDNIAVADTASTLTSSVTTI